VALACLKISKLSLGETEENTAVLYKMIIRAVIAADQNCLLEM
jgi:hypothetical protein